ncbi:MAG: SGNH/GDSL hydrolase family protein [Ruminococcaceae bacterium]|nr:SGNH/GDSL hydrolase family protein [Oscillospiraceae bacterium]
MILDFDILSKIIFGANTVEEAEGKIVIRRFSSKQAESLWGKMTSQQKRPTSVYLEFETDAESLNISYCGAVTDAQTGMLNFSLFENGLLTSHYALDHVERPKEEKYVRFPDGKAEFALQKGMKRVTVYLPLMVIELTEIAVSDGARIVPCKRNGKMAVYGDSISEGYYSEVTGMGYFDQLCRALDCEGYNFSVGGSKFRPEYIPENSVPDCDRYLVAFGTNDFRRSSKEEFHRAMPEFFKRLFAQVTEKPVYVILPVWRKTEDKVFAYGDTLFAVREAIAAEASKYSNAVVINGRELTPHAMAFMHDGTHPNSLGHTHYALNLEKRIRRYETGLNRES